MSNALELRIERRQIVAGGFEFDDRGAYERLDGQVLFAVDPSAPAQSGVVDLAKAPRNAAGRVELSADLCILKPIDMNRGNRRALFGYGNRGNKRELQFFNDAPASNTPLSRTDMGNAFLMRRGYAVVWLGWEGDLLPGDGRMRLLAPTASVGRAPLTGKHRTEFIADGPGVRYFPLSGQSTALSYPTLSRDTTMARLTRRRYAYSEREPIPPDEWSFARVETGDGSDAQGAAQAIVPSDTHIHLASGFEPGFIYELVYTARDPLVLGLGHVVVRDLVSFLKHADCDSAGTPNPTPGLERAYAWGRSQAGRCIRDFVHGGFNADVRGRRVFDGVMPHVAGAGLIWMNHRFANVISTAGQEYEDHFTPADRFPFAYAESTDHLSGRRDAILKRPETDPLVIHTQTATEYWQRRGSLVHTDTRGNDLTPPENVRIYLWASSQHFADPHARASEHGICQQYENIVQTSFFFRAMLDALDGWSTSGIAPPPSRFPRRAEGTLVGIEEWRRQFPAIPEVATPRAPNPLPRMDFGPKASEGIVTEQPPHLGPGDGYTVLVPAVDADGNELGGVRAPMVSAPLGTYTGWNLRRRGRGHGAMYQFSGSYIPFAESSEERLATRDPRPSILERYRDRAAYVRAIEAAARTLVAAGFMIEEDLERVMTEAADWGRPRHDVKLR